MASRVYRLRGSTTATASALAQIDIKRNGHIRCVTSDILQQTDVADCSACWECSFMSAAQVTANDASGIIHTHSLASLTANPASSNSHKNANIAVKVGDRIYLHVVFATGNETQTCWMDVVVEES
jgi:hypothetical protein